MIRPGEAWGEPFSGSVDLEVVGSDADLAGIVDGHEGAVVRFRAAPGSDFARSLGIAVHGEPSGLAAPVDVLRVEPGGYAVNGVVLGTMPGSLRATTPSTKVAVRVNGREIATGPATTVVVANGQFFDGLDVVPRGHPGDGRVEVQVYALRRGERRAMRTRLPQGVHVPHPRITTATGSEVEIHVEGPPMPLTIDGVTRAPVSDLTARVVPGALRLAL
ncbi:MAG: diacylglycerol/lipid kinase family protein [Acidimicrobiia bacterium]